MRMYFRRYGAPGGAGPARQVVDTAVRAAE